MPDTGRTPPAPDGLARLAARLRAGGLTNNSRRTLVLAGGAGWTLDAALAALAGIPDCTVLWLSDRPVPGAHLPLAGGVRLLGAETDVLLYDAWSGLDPDSLGAAVGTVRGGGLLCLLTPPLADWPAQPDPQAERVAVHPFTGAAVGGRYLRRLASLLPEAPGVVIVEEGQLLPEVAGPGPGDNRSTAPPGLPGPRNEDQERALGLILATARGRARRHLVISADRGRGKSSVLGLAAGRLLAGGPRRILVTAPRPDAVAALFARAAEVLSAAGGGEDGGRGTAGDRARVAHLGHGDGSLDFLPPDELVRSSPGADLLLVDEAAGIPGPVLARLLPAYPRIVFATTVHGYEGSGRGFDLRFRRTLDRETPGWRACGLAIPARWASGDPLEATAARLLMLDASPPPDTALADAQPATVRFERLDRDALARDETQLRALFGLLVLAHYQTRPMDLRHLLDGPNLRIYVLRHREAVAATALVALEGRFDPALCAAVFEGRRRPRGHLLPQTLSAHAGLERAPLLGCARTVRIAVHPAARGRGLARHLLASIATEARAEGLDLFGASFGAETDLLRFWEHCGLRPVHLGTSRNAASGAHAAVVLQSLSPAGATLVSQARRRLGERLPVLLAGPLRDLPGELAGLLLASAPPPAARLDAAGRRELAAFAHASHPFEAILPPLSALIRISLGPALRAGRLDAPRRDALISVALQNRGWADAARITGAQGRSGVVALLREATAVLLREPGSGRPRT